MSNGYVGPPERVWDPDLKKFVTTAHDIVIQVEDPEPGEIDEFDNEPAPGALLAAIQAEQRPVLPLDAAARNEYPLWDGLFAYFPWALCQVARLSKIANDQHNPGEPLHWARGKSMDHKNKILKHMLDAELLDTDNTLHATKLAWRALALLQELGEKHHGAPRAPNAY